MTEALILRKPTNLELHQKMQEKPVLATQDSYYLDKITKAHDEHYRCFDLLTRALASRGISFKETCRGEGWPQGSYQVIIALGGDGTLITASYEIHDQTPLIGIRSSAASVGFLCAGDADNLDLLIQKYLDRSLQYAPRQRLKASLQRAEGGTDTVPIAALNDFLFAAASPAATSRYRIHFQNRTESHRSSGIWISTATGSTAAIGAAGGKIMRADEQSFQFLVRELYHQKEENLQIQGGLCLPQKDEFWIENHCPSAILALDGEKCIVKVHFGDVLRFHLAEPVRVALRP